MPLTIVLRETPKRPIPRALFSKIKKRVLGERYTLSAVFANPNVMRRLNRTYRKKDSPTDVLAFPLSQSEGELYLSRHEASKRAPDFGMTAEKYLHYLFIHALLHLKGHAHGRTMEKLERKFCRALGVPFPS